jgi:hypothetical protein
VFDEHGEIVARSLIYVREHGEMMVSVMAMPFGREGAQLVLGTEPAGAVDAHCH